MALIILDEECVLVLPCCLIGVPYKAQCVESGGTGAFKLTLFAQLPLADDPTAELALCLGHIAVAMLFLPCAQVGEAAFPKHCAIALGLHRGCGGWRWSVGGGSDREDGTGDEEDAGVVAESYIGSEMSA